MTSDDATDPLANRRILVIDDNANIHADYRKILVPPAVSADLAELEADLFGETAKTMQRPAFTVDAAQQGKEGHERVLTALRCGQPYALAFVDMRMPPGWDGMETALRILADDPDIQIVICTAYSDYSWDEMAQKLGATDRVLILKKPFDTIEVIQIAQALCRKWTLGLQAKQRVASLEAMVQERVRELAASNARLSTLIKVSPVGIFVLDQEGRVTSWNPAAERIFGWNGAEVIGQQLPASMPDHLRVLMRSGEQAPVAGARQGTDVHVKRKDGVGIEVATYSAALRSPTGDPDGWIVVVADITARKQIEGELRRAKIAAEAAATAKSEFLATMSHEIRTPMNGVMGMAELLLTTRLDAEQLDFTNIIHSSGEALLAIINDILDFSKVDAGMLSLEPIPFDLLTTVSSVIELLAARAESRGIELFYRFAPDLAQAVIGDAGRVRQIITNLVGNAVKFTLKGHVFVDVARAPGGGVAIAVHDTGIGIPRDKLRLLFQKFTQADSSTTRRFGGTGLGLAISKQLAELMDGGIEVTSQPGVGSVFTATLPLPADPAPPRARTEPINLAGLKVVVADPNALSSRIVVEQLRSWGCEALPAVSAVEALAALRATAGGRVVALIDTRLAEV
ncbi:MAG: PAS domain S-box protein, partial [Planctomycetes bacterium]|nr:PAS domain S-box protein [Planctomycetota bacterium]